MHIHVKLSHVRQLPCSMHAPVQTYYEKRVMFQFDFFYRASGWFVYMCMLSFFMYLQHTDLQSVFVSLIFSPGKSL